jgi:ADP-heptose:LPS heptosyltransferase
MGRGESGAGRETKSQPVPPDEVKSILVIRPGGLGDAALTFPLLNSLGHFYHDASIDVLGETRNAGLYKASPAVRTIFCYDRKPLMTLNRLRRSSFDVVVDTEQFHHLSTLMANFFQPTYLCGFGTLSRGRLQTHPADYEDETYEVVSFLRLVEALTGMPVPFDPKAPFIEVPPQAGAWAKKTLSSSNGRPVAVVMPGATSAYRLWPVTRYARTVRWLVDRGFYVVVIGGKDVTPVSRRITVGLSSNCVLDLAGCTTVLQSLAILKRGEICLCADTGILHLAYGVGTPTVSLFGPGNHHKWAPPDRRHVAVRKNLPCSPCTRLGHTPFCSHNITCMERITVEDVTAAVERAIEL